MTTADIVKQLKHTIADELDVNIALSEIKADVSLFEDGIGLDSIAIMEFITLIEERFNFQFDDEDLGGENFKTLQTLAQFIDWTLANRAIQG